jgi:CBS domain-containing protein
VVLDADRRVIGILFERDIVRTFAEFGSDAPTKRLAQIMTREVATCGEADTAVSIMERGDFVSARRQVRARRPFGPSTEIF